MSEECTHNCESCKADCASRGAEDMRFHSNELSKIKKTVGVFSAKGGVGKSSVTSMLAVTMNRRGYKTAVLDADLTGPSIPKAFGLKQGVEGQDDMLFPAVTKTGIEVMSINLLLENEGSPVVWRGPVLGGVIKQFYEQTCWNEVDYMFVDMPPGTGDIPLTVFQSVPLDGIIIVSTPQDLVSMVVDKAINMARLMNVKVLALVENMAYYVCPDCKSAHYIFGKGRGEEKAAALGVKCYKLPINPEIASQEDAGLIELFEGSELDGLADELEKI